MFAKDDGGLLICSGAEAGWNPVSPPTLGKAAASPGPSCSGIKKAGLSSGSGLYWLAAVEGKRKKRLAYCDMTTTAGTEIGDGSTEDYPAPTCFHLQQFYGGLTSTVAKFHVGKGESFCGLDGFAITGGKAGLAPFGDGSTAAKAGRSCQFILNNFEGLENGNVRYT